jgi:hypothetical protein
MNRIIVQIDNDFFELVAQEDSDKLIPIACSGCHFCNNSCQDIKIGKEIELCNLCCIDSIIDYIFKKIDIEVKG